VWRPRTTKQCLWLGPGQHRDRGRESTANPTTGHAYPYTYGDSVHPRNTKSNPDADRNTYITDANTYADCNAYSYTYGDPHAQGDTKASPDPASSPDSVIVVATLVIGEQF
jgi:hypothetical protein